MDFSSVFNKENVPLGRLDPAFPYIGKTNIYPGVLLDFSVKK